HVPDSRLARRSRGRLCGHLPRVGAERHDRGDLWAGATDARGRLVGRRLRVSGDLATWVVRPGPGLTRPPRAVGAQLVEATRSALTRVRSGWTPAGCTRDR